MIKGKVTYYILGVVIFFALLLKLFSLGSSWVCVDGTWVRHGYPNKPQPSGACYKEPNDTQQFILEGQNKPATTSESDLIKQNAQVIIEKPQPETVISSPLVVKGQSRGNWFFEATLPIKLLDDKKATIVSAPAKADGEWMTDNLVPFSSLLEFTTTATSGYLVISKDNPSGLAENDASVTIPIKFLNK